MSIHKALSITCDGGGGNFMCTTPEYFAGAGETAREARAFLRKIGWRYAPGHPAGSKWTTGRDLCPEHTQETA